MSKKRFKTGSYLFFIFIYLIFFSSIILGLLVNGEERAYSMGTKIKGKDETIDQFTTFEIGSITKTFTATILADLELKGLVDVKNEFFRYFPLRYQKLLEEKFKGMQT